MAEDPTPTPAPEGGDPAPQPETPSAAPEPTPEPAPSGDHWSTAIEDEGLRGVASKYDDQTALAKALGIEPGSKDWREAIGDEKLREHAGRFTSLEDLVKANLDSRQKLSKAITPPGKEAKPEEVAAYRKAMGVPEDATGYKFPEIPEDKLTDDVKAEREVWAQTFHDLNVPASTAEALLAKVAEVTEAAQQQQIEADKKFAEETDKALRDKWGPDFDRNAKATERAVTDLAERAGVDIEALRHMELKDGKFLLDHPIIRQILAPVGLEMAEGNLGPALTDAERDGINGQLETVRDGIRKAQESGNSKEANRLYGEEQKLIARMQGSKPVVGAQGRAA